MFSTKNPAFKNDVFAPAQTWDDLEAARGGAGVPQAATRPKTMTIQGTVNKTGILLVFCMVSALICWNTALTNPGLAMAFLIGGGIGGFILGIVTVIKPKFASFTAPLYAIAQGLFVGGISAFYAQQFAETQGSLNTALIINAGLITFGICAGLLCAYSFRIIRPGVMFRNITITLMIGLGFYMVIAFLASMFMGSYSLISVYDPSNGGMISIGFSLFVVALASAKLVLDFQLIEEGVKAGAPKHMEWYGGFAILMTIVWMYLEILRLLAKLQSRD